MRDDVIQKKAYTKTEGVLGNLVFRTMIFNNVGDYVDLHAHPFDHVTVVIRGPLELTVEGETRVVEDGERILTRKDIRHGFKALKDNCLAYCIHTLSVGVPNGAF